jgi:hypothetical protein
VPTFAPRALLMLGSAPTSLAWSDGDYLRILIEDTGIGGFVVDVTRARRFHGQEAKSRSCTDKRVASAVWT